MGAGRRIVGLSSSPCYRRMLRASGSSRVGEIVLRIPVNPLYLSERQSRSTTTLSGQRPLAVNAEGGVAIVQQPDERIAVERAPWPGSKIDRLPKWPSAPPRRPTQTFGSVHPQRVPVP